MLNMGFKEDLALEILKHTPEEKTDMVVSAYMPKEIRRTLKTGHERSNRDCSKFWNFY